MATYQGPSPGAAQYGMYAAQAQQALQNATARIQSQRAQMLTSAGLQGQYDSNGGLTDFSVASGPGSEFGSYQQMTRGLAGDAASTDAAVGAFGFHGGLAQQTQDAQHMQDSATSADWGNQIQQGLGDLAGQDQQNQQDYNSSLFSQFQQQVNDAVANGTFNPADYSGIQVPGYDNPFAGYTPPPGSTGGLGSGNGGGSGGGVWSPPPPPKQGKRRRRR